MFVDASVIVAILKPEADGQTLSDQVERSDSPLTSPIAVVEAVMSLARNRRLPVEVALSEVMQFLERGRIPIRPVDAEAGMFAVDAHARFGKGSGHPARLNLGDCFAYAMAKQHSVPLLYTGDDFAQTDLA